MAGKWIFTIDDEEDRVFLNRTSQRDPFVPSTRRQTPTKEQSWRSGRGRT